MKKSNKADTSEESAVFLQYMKIKERLYEYYKPMSKYCSIASVRKQLEDSIGFSFSYTAVRDVLTENDKAPNMGIVIGLCRLWHLDYSLILAPTEQNVSVEPSEHAFEQKLEVLTDPKYHGIFYGYKYTRNKGRDEIVSFQLELRKQGNSVEARMHTHSKPSYVGGKKGNFDELYIGTPYLVKKTETISMLLINEDGHFYSLTYDYASYGFDQLYFRKGIAITAESNSEKPYLMNFLLFQYPVSEEKQQKYFPGMLKLIENVFYVPKEEVSSLLNDDDFSRCMNKYCPHLEERERSLYFFKVSTVLDNIDNYKDIDEVNEAMRFLFQLQGKATTLSAIEYANPEGLPNFAKTYLQVDTV